MIKNKIKLLLLLLILLSSCQAVKDGLTGKKSENSDEFLVQKKNPLELPPDFTKLPVPKKDTENINQSEEIDEEIENLFNNSAEIDLSDDSNDSNQSAEDFVLNEINNN
tara:strand:+ start:184 stop:510 length:327 start_codon:yes stop_codon:yes gene_type:complete